MIVRLLVVASCLWANLLSAAPPALPVGTFVNPIAEGADPSIVKDGGHYLWCQSEGNRGISIWRSNRLHSMGTKHVVWQAPDAGPLSREVWAPELLKLDSHWYIYFAASDGENKNHRTYVLKSKTGDPLGQYSLHGPLYTGDHFETKQDNLWAIDMTVLTVGGKRYAIWSGWSTKESDHQYLYIAPMKSPTELAGPRIKICESDDYVWERTEENLQSRGLHEAPQVIQDGSQTFLIYSCGASWLSTYKLGALQLVGDDPLKPASWKKLEHPVFESQGSTIGVGHGNFVRSPDDSQWWHIYHAKVDQKPGWRRAIFLQPMTWSEAGIPALGQPVQRGQPLDLPAGTNANSVNQAHDWDLSQTSSHKLMDVYSHHQLFKFSDRGIELGVQRDDVINGYRTGEKMIVRDSDYGDLKVTATFQFLHGQRDAGIVFRTTAPAVGYDSQRGYFAGIVPQSHRIIVGKMDGTNWHHLGHADIDLDYTAQQSLTVHAVGNQIQVFFGDDPKPQLSVVDGDYARGSIGLRVVDTHAIFHELSVRID